MLPLPPPPPPLRSIQGLALPSTPPLLLCCLPGWGRRRRPSGQGQTPPPPPQGRSPGPGPTLPQRCGSAASTTPQPDPQHSYSKLKLSCALRALRASAFAECLLPPNAKTVSTLEGLNSGTHCLWHCLPAVAHLNTARVNEMAVKAQRNCSSQSGIALAALRPKAPTIPATATTVCAHVQDRLRSTFTLQPACAKLMYAGTAHSPFVGLKCNCGNYLGVRQDQINAYQYSRSSDLFSVRPGPAPSGPSKSINASQTLLDMQKGVQAIRIDSNKDMKDHLKDLPVLESTRRSFKWSFMSLFESILIACACFCISNKVCEAIIYRSRETVEVLTLHEDLFPCTVFDPRASCGGVIEIDGYAPALRRTHLRARTVCLAVS